MIGRGVSPFLRPPAGVFGSSCPLVTGLINTGLTYDTVTIGWDANGGTDFDIYYGPTPLTAPDSGTSPTTTSVTNSKTITGLDPETQYSFYVRTNCGASVSAWSSVLNVAYLGIMRSYALDGNAVDGTGTLNGTPANITYAAGKLGQAASFNGTSSKIDIGTPLTAASGTISVWVNPADVTTHKRFFSDALGYIVFRILSGNFTFIIDDGTGGKTLTTTISISTWTHFTCCWDGTNIFLYKNGVQVGATACGNIGNVTGLCSMGMYAGGFWYNGLLDQFQVWSRILLPEEISDLYNVGAGNAYPMTVYTPAIPFTITVKTDNAGTSTSSQFTIPLNATDAYSFLVEKEGVTTRFKKTIGSGTNNTLTFSAPGTYTVKIKGVIPQIIFNNAGDKLKLLDITAWGAVKWGQFNSAFYGCTNLTGTYTDSPNVSTVTTAAAAFLNCSSFNGSFGWNWAALQTANSLLQNCTLFTGSGMSNCLMPVVTTLESAFSGCQVFNGVVSGIATGGQLTTMENVFSNCWLFNQPLTNWNTTNVTTMRFAFNECRIFNQSIDNLANANVISTYGYMFHCHAYNQPQPNLTFPLSTTFRSAMEGCHVFNQEVHFTFENADIIDYCFFSCYAFNQLITTHQDYTTVTSAEGMLAFAIAYTQNLAGMNLVNCTNMTNFLNDNQVYPNAQVDNFYNWLATLVLQPNVPLGMTDLHYTAAGAAARAILTGAPNNWIITDLGQQ